MFPQPVSFVHCKDTTNNRNYQIFCKIKMLTLVTFRLFSFSYLFSFF